MVLRTPVYSLRAAQPCLRLAARRCPRQRVAGRFYSDEGSKRSAAKEEEWVERAVPEEPVLADDGYSDSVATPRSRRERAAATAQQLAALQARAQRQELDTPTAQTDIHSPSSSLPRMPDLTEDQLEADFAARPTLQQELTDLEQYDAQDITPVTFVPDSVSKPTLLHSGQGSATITAGNFEGVVQDRIKALTERALDTTRHAPEMAKRMMRGGLVSFNSAEERDAVVGAAKEYAHRLKRSAGNVRKGLNDVVTEHEFAPLPEKVQYSIVERYVRGKHADLKAEPSKTPVMNEVRRGLYRNSTYLPRDGAVFYKKVEQLVALGQPKAQGKAARK